MIEVNHILTELITILFISSVSSYYLIKFKKAFSHYISILAPLVNIFIFNRIVLSIEYKLFFYHYFNIALDNEISSLFIIFLIYILLLLPLFIELMLKKNLIFLKIISLAILIYSSLIFYLYQSIERLDEQKIQSYFAFDSKLSKHELVSNILFWVSNNYNLDKSKKSSDAQAFMNQNDLSYSEIMLASSTIISNYGIPIRYIIFHNENRTNYIYTFEIYLNGKWVLYDSFNFELFTINGDFIEAVQLDIVDENILHERKNDYKKQILMIQGRLIPVNSLNIRRYY